MCTIEEEILLSIQKFEEKEENAALRGEKKEHGDVFVNRTNMSEEQFIKLVNKLNKRALQRAKQYKKIGGVFLVKFYYNKRKDWSVPVFSYRTKEWCDNNEFEKENYGGCDLRRKYFYYFYHGGHHAVEVPFSWLFK